MQRAEVLLAGILEQVAAIRMTGFRRRQERPIGSMHPVLLALVRGVGTACAPPQTQRQAAEAALNGPANAGVRSNG